MCVYIYMKNEFEIEIGILNHQIQEYKNYYNNINVILHI